jgi:hypothetical protein
MLFHWHCHRLFLLPIRTSINELTMKRFLRFPSIVTLGIIATLVSSCAPKVTTYQLKPVSGNVALVDGRSVTRVDQNGIGIVASFEREDQEFVTLDVEIKNLTRDSLDVNPADFRFTALNSRQDTLSDPRNTALSLTRSAADPAYEAGRLVSKRKQEEKRLKRAKIINTVLMVATIASDVSSSSRSRSYSEYANNRLSHSVAYEGIAIKRAVDHSTFANRMQRYDYEEYRWRELALRQHTLAPGETVRGLVYLTKVPDARFLAITYTIPEQATVPLLFEQELVKQRKKRR